METLTIEIEDNEIELTKEEAYELLSQLERKLLSLNKPYDRD